MIVRRIIVRFIARQLRPGRHGHQRLTKSQVREALAKAFPHRSYDWREQLLEEARTRNYRS